MVRSTGRAPQKKLWKYHPNSTRCSCRAWRLYRSIQSGQTTIPKTDVMFVHYREKIFPCFPSKKSDIFILLHLSTTSGPQESNSMFFQRKGIPDLWIAVQNIWNFRKISQMLCTVIHRHNDERKTAVRWQKLHKSGTMDSLRKGVPAMAIKYTEEQLNSVDKSMLIQMFLNQQEQLEKVSANLHSLDTKMQAMMEQLIIGNKKTVLDVPLKKWRIPSRCALSKWMGPLCFFNEAEAVCDLTLRNRKLWKQHRNVRKKQKAKKRRICLNFLQIGSITT